MTFRFFNPADKVSISQGHLPHWDQAEATYFITWRTADSMPREVWLKWRRERDGWLLEHGISPLAKDWRRQVEDLSEEERSDFRQFSHRLEHEMDACHGECLLRQPELASHVAEALRFFDGSRYSLGDFVIMPNHVHLLVGGLVRHSMLKQVASWKKWSALKINEALGRRGRFWQDESFDHLVRHQASFDQLRSYIADNPAKAGLKAGEFLYWRRH